MASLLINNVTVVLSDRLLRGQSVLCQDGKIAKVWPFAAAGALQADEVIDGAGGYLAPGFIDLHMHGSHRFLVDNGPADLAGLCSLLPRWGVTGFLPTVCPRPKGEDAAELAKLATVVSSGTAILGFHLEGPFLSLTGALPAEAIGKADPDRVQALIEAAKPYKAIFSVSPDFAGVLDLIPLMARDDTAVFMTHTAATAEQTLPAIEAGVRHATHFYDVWYAPKEADPGVRPCGAVEAALADPRVSVDFILDGEHVSPVAIKMALACKGPDRVCLITDANIGAGLPPGRYAFGKEEVQFAYAGGPARLTEKSHVPGGLAGSGLTMDQAVRNAVSMLGLDIPQAVRMASANVAKVLKLDGSKGHVAVGMDGDLVLLDEKLNVKMTVVAGRKVYG